MTNKRKCIKFAKFIRRHCKMKLPESVKVARFYLNWANHWYPVVPANIEERLEPNCCEGCCYKTFHYVMSREGKMLRLQDLARQFNHDEF